jgi:predicted RNase H-like HicB family nuclease
VRYAVFIEKGPTSYGAYVPDLPGCVAAAPTLEEVKSLIKRAIEIHLEDVPASQVPPPFSTIDYIDVAV